MDSIMTSKFMGIGLLNALSLAVFTMIISVFLKTLFSKYEVEGLSDFVRAA